VIKSFLCLKLKIYQSSFYLWHKEHWFSERCCLVW